MRTKSLIEHVTQVVHRPGVVLCCFLLEKLRRLSVSLRFKKLDAVFSAETIKSEEQSAALKAARAKFWVIKMLLNTIGGTLANSGHMPLIFFCTPI